MDKNLYDVIIVGAGPAGLSAAIYMARAKYRVLVLEKAEIGGQITITSEIVNYPGVELTSGKELTEKMRVQAQNFGAEIVLAEVMDMELGADIKVLHTTRGDYRALGVILAPGANPRKLGFKGEKQFQGRGVAYCATCDGEFFTGKEVFVIGGGFAAVEESIFLTKYASKITIVVREEDFTCAKTIVDKLKNYDKIRAVFETELLEVGGESALSYAKFIDNKKDQTWEYRTDDSFGIFVFAGYVPSTGWIGNHIDLDAQGYIITDANKKTNIEGVYAAGDVCVKNLRQVVTAVADGAIAATSLEKIVSEKHDKLSIPDLYVEKENPIKQAKEEKEEIKQKKATSRNSFIDDTIRNQLRGVFAKFSSKVIVKAWLDDSNLSAEMRGFLGEFTDMTDKVTWQEGVGKPPEGMIYPAMEILRENGESSKIVFHAVPGGHEFNSFVIALYNVAGPGQEIDETTKREIEALDRKTNIKILVSLSCTMCPETVMSSQKIASMSENITAEMFDLTHFPKLKTKYNVMSVPCIVINDEKLSFGKKNIQDMLEIIKNGYDK